MTTNSPNPVDVDVQAHQMPELTQAERQVAIDSCVAEITHLERCIKAYPDQPVLKIDLLVQKVALASLTAQPVADVVSWIHPKEERKCAVQLRRFDLMPGCLYTTPPAQLLRPVELPEEAPNALVALCQQMYDHKSTGTTVAHDVWQDCLHELLQQGYEVRMINLPDEKVIHDGKSEKARQRCEGWNECIAEVQHLNATAQPVRDGWVTVPRSLTAENGAKAALLGEFSVQQNITCHECFGEGCDDCNGQGNWTNNVPVDWTTIKEIWAKGVEHFLAAAPGGQDD